ncbi:hypothetical protein ACWATR_04085 [Nostoc sp. UIC 10890]
MTFGLGGKIITFAHNKGTQTDSTDTLQNLEFAQFSDRIPNECKKTFLFLKKGLSFDLSLIPSFSHFKGLFE